MVTCLTGLLMAHTVASWSLSKVRTEACSFIKFSDISFSWQTISVLFARANYPWVVLPFSTTTREMRYCWVETLAELAESNSRYFPHIFHTKDWSIGASMNNLTGENSKKVSAGLTTTDVPPRESDFVGICTYCILKHYSANHQGLWRWRAAVQSGRAKTRWRLEDGLSPTLGCKKVGNHDRHGLFSPGSKFSRTSLNSVGYAPWPNKGILGTGWAQM